MIDQKSNMNLHIHQRRAAHALRYEVPNFKLGSFSNTISYGFPGSSKRIEIPNGRIGVIIGKGGETVKYLQLQSGAKIQVTRDMDADPNFVTRLVELMGTPDQVAKAEQLITDVLSEAETGGSGTVPRRVTGQFGPEQFVMKIPNNKVGLVIGKGGDTIKSMQARIGACIQFMPNGHKPNLYGTLTEFCTSANCPTMNVGPKYEYRWADRVTIKKPMEVSAPKYVEYLMDWIEVQLDDESIFPQRLGAHFPSNF